jgi:CHAT domain-containing protein/Flp pilus assembly protein TadD
MMQSLFFVLAVLSATTARPAAPGTADAPAAIVYALTGEAFQITPPPAPVHLFDCLPAGAVLEVAPGARLSLAFATGKRWSLAGGARVTLGAKDLESRTGDVHRLEPVSALPRLARILDGEHAGARPGAVRGEQIKGLYPGGGAAAIASATMLQFQAVEGAERYKVEVQDGRGRIVFMAETDETGSHLKAGLLRPGATYSWTVRTVGRVLGEARGEAAFTTLDRETERRREALRRAAAGNQELTALLAAIDHRLGLEKPVPGLIVDEATAGFAAARAGILPGDLLQSWERAASPPANPLPASGRLDSPFDLLTVESEQAPRGMIRLNGVRAGNPRTWELPPGDWRLTPRPPLGDEPEPAAWRLQSLAETQIRNGDRAAARATYENLLAALGPLLRPATVARLRGKLARNLRDMGELALSAEQLHQALSAQRSVAPESLVEAELLSGLSRALLLQGDSNAAEQQLSRALSLAERLAPGSSTVTQMLGNLGIVETHLGNLAAAEDLQRRALEIDRKLNPDSLDVANILTNLANLESSRRDFEAAREDYRQALSLHDKLDPESDGVATALENLGGVLLSLDDPAGAAEVFERSLALRRQLHHTDPEILDTLIGLGTAAWARHDYAPAERWLRQALEISEKERRGSLGQAVVLNNLADVLLEQKRLTEAENLCRRALAMFQELAPGTHQEGTAYRDLAVIVRRAGRKGEARDLYVKALLTIDRAGWQLAGSGQGRSDFLSSYASYYREAVDLLVELGHPEEAFAILERFRARDLLGLLAERKLSFEGDIPAPLENERQSANADYERILRQFAALSPDSPAAERKELQTRLDQARLHQETVRARIRTQSPRLAALRDPEPLELTATAAALDPGTALLSYSIGEERSYLFVVGPEAGHFTVFPLPTSRKSLDDEVRRLRANPPDALRAAQPLTKLLLAPAAREIAAAERLLVVADGPLHLLPFALLADPAAPRFLIEAKPIFTAASATLFAELKGRRRENRIDSLLAFGDPRYPAAPPSHDPVLRGALREGLQLDPLPGTRAEVERLRALFPENAQVFLGTDATEERAKALAPERSIVHFACHALVNERHPLESALVLSLPDHPQEGGDNGLLQAWEIFEQMHLDADLVTLSACDSALGKELAGEGLLGLTRAFQYAGAHSILASLWGVGDAGTAELMRRFYGHLKAGETKDEALRHAQVDLLRGAAGSELASPFYWAAFEMIGDWR